MDLTNWIMVGVSIAAVAGLVVYYLKRQKAMYEGFEQVASILNQVPKQKKNYFILFMFRESARAGKNGEVNIQKKLNDPKNLELQLLQMSMILKDRSKVKDKNNKRALRMYDAYLNWEKSKKAKTTSAA